MYRDSHKAQRNSFAYHRAELLLSIERDFVGDATELSAASGAALAFTPDPKAACQLAPAGAIGFAHAGMTAA